MLKEKTVGNEIFQELETIRRMHGGILKPIDTVKFARDPKSALHSKFEWDDSEAAHQHRLWQARQLIAVHVQYIGSDKRPTRVFVSLVEDRYDRDGGGYRTLQDVMVDPIMRASLLNQALLDLERFQEKYNRLLELRPIFDAISKFRLEIKN